MEKIQSGRKLFKDKIGRIWLRRTDALYSRKEKLDG